MLCLTEALCWAILHSPSYNVPQWPTLHSAELSWATTHPIDLHGTTELLCTLTELRRSLRSYAAPYTDLHCTPCWTTLNSELRYKLIELCFDLLSYNADASYWAPLQKVNAGIGFFTGTGLNRINPISAFRHQGKSGTAGHELNRHFPPRLGGHRKRRFRARF